MNSLRPAFAPFLSVSIPALSLALFVGSAIVSSDITAEQVKPESLPELFVSATRSTNIPSTLPAAHILIDREQIALSGASSFAEILATTAGIQLTDLFGNGSSVTVGMRGFGDNAALNSLIMIDGRRLNNSLDIGSARLSGINIDDIEAIEIISGSAGVLFGESAVGGVINIITRSVSRHARVELNGGSYHNEQYRVSVADQANDWDFAISAEKRLADNYRNHNHSDTETVDLEIGRTLNTGRIWLEVAGSNELQQLPGALFASEYAANRKASRNYTDFLDGQYRTYRGGANIALGDQWQLEIDITNRVDDIDGSQVAFGSPSATRQEREQSSVNPRLIGRYSKPEGDIIITSGFDYDDADYFLSSIFGIQEAEQKAQSLYAQLLFPVLDTLSFQAGARYSRLESELKDSFTFPAGTSDDDDFTRNSFGLEWSPQENVKLFLRRDENFRFAKIEEHTNQFNFVGLYQPLNHQQGVSLETGVRISADQTIVSFSYYELKLTDEIIYDGTTFSNINLDTTKRVGADLGIISQLSSAVAVNFQLSLVDATFDSGPYSDKEIPFVARQNISVGVDYQSADLGSFHAEWLETGKRFAASDFDNSFARIKSQNQLNVAWRLEVKRISVEARINNLTNRNNLSFATVAYNPALFGNDVGFYAAPERNFLITLSYQPDI